MSRTASSSHVAGASANVGAAFPPASSCMADAPDVYALPEDDDDSDLASVPSDVEAALRLLQREVCESQSQSHCLSACCLPGAGHARGKVCRHCRPDAQLGTQFPVHGACASLPRVVLLSQVYSLVCVRAPAARCSYLLTLAHPLMRMHTLLTLTRRARWRTARRWTWKLGACAPRGLFARSDSLLGALPTSGAFCL